MSKKRRVYSSEFKLEAVKLSIESEKTVKEISEELGISYQVLCKWRSAYNADKEGCFPGKGNIKASDREIYELRKELSDVKQEREILKKALAIFSKAHPKNTLL